jgi:transposase
VPVSRFQEWLHGSIVPLLLGVPAEKLGDESRLGRVLEKVGPVAEGIWGEVVARAFERFGFDLTALINDTSSFYFEGEYDESTVVKYGYSRDKRPDCKQVNVTLNVTERDAIPLWYKVLPGNTADATTAKGNAEALRKLLAAMGEATRRLVIIADRGLLTRSIVHYYKDVGIGFIGCILATADEEAAIAKVPHEELLQSPLDYTPARIAHRSEARRSAERYYGVRRDVVLSQYKDESTGQVYPSISLNGLVVFATGKQRLDSQKRDDQLLRLEVRLGEIASHLNSGRYKKEDFAKAQVDKALRKYPPTRGMISYELKTLDNGELSLRWERDQARIDKAAFLDGKYIVFTTETNLSDSVLFRRYKSRDKVE